MNGVNNNHDKMDVDDDMVVPPLITLLDEDFENIPEDSIPEKYQIKDSGEARFQYTFKRIQQNGFEQRLSPPIFVHGIPWKILLTWKHDRRNPTSMGCFLQCNGTDTSSAWTCNGYADITLHNNDPNKKAMHKNISHLFHHKENDWGFQSFIDYQELINPDKGYIRDDSIRIEVHVHADPPHGMNWDSKARTGYVGLKNQGATCYMNSLLQSLYFITEFRAAIYKMHVSKEEENSPKCIPVALQRVFYELQFGDRSVATKKLTKSFGWDNMDTFVQHDASELLRILVDNLENKMQKTNPDNAMAHLFRGKQRAIIKCIDVDYISEKNPEVFYDIPIFMKDISDLNEAFKQLTTPQRMSGDNKYYCEPHRKLVDADMITRFMELPPVLHIHLMRFMYDYDTESIVKNNDYFKFPRVIDLAPYMERPDSDVGANVYQLHAVLVHSGDNHGGHYVAYIDPHCDNRWCKFDDDVVCRCTPREAIQLNYGHNPAQQQSSAGGATPPTLFASSRSNTNAYLLTYVRRRDIPTLLRPLDSEKDIPDSVVQRFKLENDLEAQRKRDKERASQLINLAVLTDESLTGDQVDLFDRNRAKYTLMRISKDATVRELHAAVAKCAIPPSRAPVFDSASGVKPSIADAAAINTNTSAVGGPLVAATAPTALTATIQPADDKPTAERPAIGPCRVFLMVLRNNQTFRPAIISDYWDQTLGEAFFQQQKKFVSDKMIKPEGHFIGAGGACSGYYIYVQRIVQTFSPMDTSLSPWQPQKPTSEDSDKVLLMFKYFDYRRKTLRYVCSHLFPKKQRLEHESRMLCRHVGLPLDTPLIFYEERDGQEEPCRLQNKIVGEAIAEVTPGDIVIYQEAPPPSSVASDNGDDMMTTASAVMTPGEYFHELKLHVEVVFKEINHNLHSNINTNDVDGQNNNDGGGSAASQGCITLDLRLDDSVKQHVLPLLAKQAHHPVDKLQLFRNPPMTSSAVSNASNAPSPIPIDCHTSSNQHIKLSDIVALSSHSQQHGYSTRLQQTALSGTPGAGQTKRSFTLLYQRHEMTLADLAKKILFKCNYYPTNHHGKSQQKTVAMETDSPSPPPTSGGCELAVSQGGGSAATSPDGGGGGSGSHHSPTTQQQSAAPPQHSAHGHPIEVAIYVDRHAFVDTLLRQANAELVRLHSHSSDLIGSSTHQLRLEEVHNHRIERIIARDQEAHSLATSSSTTTTTAIPTTTSTLRLVDVLPDEADLDPSLNEESLNDSGSRATPVATLATLNTPKPAAVLVQVVHHNTKDMIHPFGTPFFVRIVEGDRWCDVRRKIQKRLDVGDKEFEKWPITTVDAASGASKLTSQRVSAVSGGADVDPTGAGTLNATGAPSPLVDMNLFQPFTLSTRPSTYIALHHAEKKLRSITEKPVVIRN